MQAPSTTHWTSAKLVLRYLKGSLDCGLLYRKGGDISLNAYCDFNWAGNPDD